MPSGAFEKGDRRGRPREVSTAIKYDKRLKKGLTKDPAVPEHYPSHRKAPDPIQRVEGACVVGVVRCAGSQTAAPGAFAIKFRHHRPEMKKSIHKSHHTACVKEKRKRETGVYVHTFTPHPHTTTTPFTPTHTQSQHPPHPPTRTYPLAPWRRAGPSYAAARSRAARTAGRPCACTTSCPRPHRPQGPRGRRGCWWAGGPPGASWLGRSPASAACRRPSPPQQAGRAPRTARPSPRCLCFWFGVMVVLWFGLRLVSWMRDVWW